MLSHVVARDIFQKDLVHQKFGKLEVLEYAYSPNNKNY